MALLKYENDKLKEQLIFSIPVSKEICGRECPGCYALKPQKRFPAVLKSRETTYEVTKHQLFPIFIAQHLLEWNHKLKKKGVKQRVVRIHEAGEFYSEEYINKWYMIAERHKDWKFYAFTKRLEDFPEAFKLFMSLPNVYVTDSLHGGKINYGKAENSRLTFICPATVGNVKCTPEECTWCYQDGGSVTNGVYFKKH